MAKKDLTKIPDVKIILSTLWIFLTLNYIYCDVFSLTNPEDLKQILTGNVGSIHITQGFLLTFAMIMEIPIAMIILSRVLNYKANRWANISAGAVMGSIQTASLFFGTAPALHYIFFSIIEISSNIFIVWYAWKWPKENS